MPYQQENVLNEVKIVNYLVTKALEMASANSTNSLHLQNAVSKDISLAYHLIYFEHVGVCNQSQMLIVLMPLLGKSLSCLKIELTAESPLQPYLPALIVYNWTIQMVSEQFQCQVDK